jgi:hypothetical protein
MEVKMKRMVLAAAAALLVSAPAYLGSVAAAQAGAPAHDNNNACLSAKSWVANVQHRSEGVSVLVLTDLNGVEAKAVVDRINATPPETNMKADHVIVLGARALVNNAVAPYVLVAFFNHDCLVTSGRADPREAAQMLGGQSI